jgi:hypothetical protein
MGLAGHSMGGGITGLVLANNPGYRCGFAFAPVFPGVATANVAVPFGFAVGTGDVITPWDLFALPYYQTVGCQGGIKFLYLMNDDCDHMNVAGLTIGARAGVFDRTFDVSLGFFRAYLRDDPSGLEKCVGRDAVSEPGMTALLQEVARPEIWSAEPLRLGQTVRVSLAVETGFCGVIAATSVAPGVSTQLGTMMLDQSTAFPLVSGTSTETRFDSYVYVPNNVNLIGLTFAMQGLGSTTSALLTLGGAVQLVIQP